MLTQLKTRNLAWLWLAGSRRVSNCFRHPWKRTLGGGAVAKSSQSASCSCCSRVNALALALATTTYAHSFIHLVLLHFCNIHCYTMSLSTPKLYGRTTLWKEHPDYGGRYDFAVRKRPPGEIDTITTDYVTALVYPRHIFNVPIPFSKPTYYFTHFHWNEPDGKHTVSSR